MKTTKIFCAAVLAALAFTSCSSDEAPASQGAPDGAAPVLLNTGILQASEGRRAATNLNETKLTSGDAAVFTSTNWATKYTYTAQSDGSLTTDSYAFYPNDGSSISITSVYPADKVSTAAATTTSIEVGEDQSSDDAYIDSDLLWAQLSGKTKASGAQTLNFQHKMVKIIVNVTAGLGVSTINTVTLKNIKRRYDFNAQTGVVSNVVSVSSHTDIAVGTNNCAAVIPAQTLSGEFVAISTDQGTATYSFDSDKAVVAGNYYQLNITVNRANVGGTNTVNSWSGSGTVNITPNTPQQTFDVTNNSLLTFNVNGVQFTMVGVKGGSYTTLGGTTGLTASLTDYYIGQTEVTNALYKAVMGSTPSNAFADKGNHGKDDEYPVQTISWNSINEASTGFLAKLNAMLADQLPTGKTFKLPTEAQWEYAARGGQNQKDYTYAGSGTINEVAWYGNGGSGTTTETGGARTYPVATKMPNSLGLYDMSGNVWEWCQDWYQNPLNDGNLNLGSDYVCTTEGSHRVIRGGSWDNTAGYCSVSGRYVSTPTSASGNIGFRLSLQ